MLIRATLETAHRTIKAFGNNKPEAHMTLHYAWQSYAKQFDVSPHLIGTLRFSITYEPAASSPYASGTANHESRISPLSAQPLKQI
jgi:hypothetical protein